MPYTQEELQKNEYYQNLINEDEQRYEQQRALYQTAFLDSGGENDGSLLVRDKDNTILLFENPYTGELYEDETTSYVKTVEVEQFKINEDILDEVINRNITEL
tara:strand:+ start:12998 stop:13306 length:309 start_codon:yes stop_codon:yes gene_type:complete